ncbi:MAG: peptidase domain-containing ABC transporter [Pseudomonadota bacterium]
MSTPFSREEAIWLLGSLCNLHRVPFDERLVLQEFPPPYDLDTFRRAAQALGLKVGSVRLSADLLGALPAPALAYLKAAANDPSASPAASPGARTPVLLVHADKERLLYFRTGSVEPQTLLLADMESHIEPDIHLVGPDTAARDARVDDDGNPSAAAYAPPRAFGFHWFVPELLRHKTIWRDVLLASLALQVVGLVTPLCTQIIIDKVVVHQATSTLAVVGAALVLFMLFSAAMTALRQYLILHTGNRVDAVLGAQVFRHLFRLPMPCFEQRATGTLVARLQGLDTIREFLTGAAIALVLDLPFLLICLAVMFFYSWQLSLIVVGVMSLVVLLSVMVRPLLDVRLADQFRYGARNQAFLTEYLAGMATVKSLQMEPVLERRYGDYLATYLQASFRTRQLANGYGVTANTLEQVMTLAVLLVGALIVMRHAGFTIGMLVAFQMFAGRVSQPLLRLAGLWQEFRQASLAVRRLGDIMDLPAEPHGLVPQRAHHGLARVEFRGLGFRYSGQQPFLYEGLNLALAPGQLTVLMGPSGSGKSTLAKLLQGFYLPTSGAVLLDGRDIRHFSSNELRAQLGVVPQETVLFSGTVYDNLSAARAHAGFEDIQAACRQAGIHDTIEHLPQGYQTILGEHGVGLSGGQRQRLAIARALLKKPRLLIFDEATASLDMETAAQIADTVNRLKGRATILFITHQLPRGLLPDRVECIGSDAGGEGCTA